MANNLFIYLLIQLFIDFSSLEIPIAKSSCAKGKRIKYLAIFCSSFIHFKCCGLFYRSTSRINNFFSLLFCFCFVLLFCIVCLNYEFLSGQYRNDSFVDEMIELIMRFRLTNMTSYSIFEILFCILLSHTRTKYCIRSSINQSPTSKMRHFINEKYCTQKTIAFMKPFTAITKPIIFISFFICPNLAKH